MGPDLLRYLEEQVESCVQERAALPAQYDTLKEQHDKVVRDLEQETARKVRAAGEELENVRRKVQSRADFLAGKIDALRHFIERVQSEQARPAPVVSESSPDVLDANDVEDCGDEGEYEWDGHEPLARDGG